MISDQIMPIEWVNTLGCYAIRASLSSALGDDTLIDHDLAVRLAHEYRSTLVELCLDANRRITALGLAISAGGRRSEYVEIDEWSQPIEAGAGGLEAATFVHNVILSRSTENLLGHDELVQLYSWVLNEGVPLKLAIFRRLFEHYERLGLRPPNQLYHLLPWELINTHLRNVRLISSSSTGHDRLPDLGSYFHCVSNTLVPSLRAITDWNIQTDPERTDRAHVAAFLEAVWLIDLGRLPGVTCDLLLKAVRNCTALSRKSPDLVRPDEQRPGDPTQNRSVVRGLLLLNRIRAAGGKAHLHRRVQNLAAAAQYAAQADLLTRYVHLLDNELIESLKSAAAALPTQPDQFRQTVNDYFNEREQKLSSHTPTAANARTSNYLLDAGEVCKFSAEIHARLEGNLEAAGTLAVKAEPYYRLAATLADGIRPRLYKRWTRKLLLEGEISSDSSLAFDKFESALRLIRQVPADTDDDEAAYGNAILQAQCLFGIARVQRARSEDTSVTREAFLNCLDWPSSVDNTAAVLLADFRLEIDSDPKAALAHLDADIERLQASPRADQPITQRRIEYLQYYAAKISALSIEEIPASAVDAIGRMAEALKAQPTNVRLLDLLLESAGKARVEYISAVTELVDRHLVPIKDLRCPITHAAARLYCGIPNAQDIGSLGSTANTLVSLVNRAELQWSPATEALLNSSHDDYLVERTLEVLSKWYFRRGERRASQKDLTIAARLLDAALEKKPDDVVWLSRRIEISLAKGNFDAARRLLGAIPANADPVLNLQAARLRIMSGELDQAEEILNTNWLSKSASEVIHPAVLDSLAFVALRKGDIDKAKEYYFEIIRQNVFDARAEFGLGRIELSRGASFYVNAFVHWCSALRLQTRAESEIGRGKYGWRTAYSIAGLFRKEELDQSVHAKLTDILMHAIRNEELAVSGRIVDALRHVGVTDILVANALMGAIDSSADIQLRKKVARFLIGVLLKQMLVKADSQDETARVISWCRKQDVLTDFLRALNQSSGTISRVSLDLRFAFGNFEATMAERLRTRTVPTLGDLALAPSGASDKLISGLTQTVLVSKLSEASTGDVASGIVPAVATWRLQDLVKSEIKIPETAGFVDYDLLQLTSRDLGFGNWSASGTRIERRIMHLPSKERMPILNQGGIYFNISPKTDAGLSMFFVILDNASDAGVKLEADD